MDSQSLRKLRADFPILSTRFDGQPLVYFDNAATTQKPRQVIDAITQFYRKENANVHRAAHRLSSRATEHFEQARDAVARFLNCSSEEVIWTRGTTESLNLVAQSYLRPLLKAGETVLVMQSSHHANIVPWQQVTQSCGANLQVIPLDEAGDIDLNAYQQLLETTPKLVALTHVSNALGTIYPIAEMIRMAKEAGATVVVDGAQAVPHLQIDLTQLGADFYAFSGHKLFGPTGIGVLYGASHLLELMPPWQTGGEMIEKVSFDGTTFTSAPLRFEAGTPDIAGAVGLKAAVEYLEKQDSDALFAHEAELAKFARQQLSLLPGIKLLPAGSEQVSVITFTHMDLHASDIAALLDESGIAVRAGTHCAQPLLTALNIESAVRVSLAFYNSLEEVEHLISTLETIVSSTANSSETIEESNTLFIEKRDDLIRALSETGSWPERLNLLMKLGSLKGKDSQTVRIAANEVVGCASRTWIELSANDGQISIKGDSDSRQINALIHLISEGLERSLNVDQIRSELDALGLERQLSRTRGNAIQTLLKRVEALSL